MKYLSTLLLLTILSFCARAQVGIGTVSPNSMLDLRGSFAPIFRSFTGATALTTNDYTVVFTGGTAATATLPDATTCPGRIYCIKNFSSTLPAPALTIGTVSSQQIDGAATWLLNQSYTTITVISDGSNWEVFNQYTPSSIGSYWSLGGNSVTGTLPLGTTSAFDLPFITNNTEKMRITSAGSVGIGSTAFSTNPEALLVYQNNPTSFNVIGGKGNLNNYLQLNIQNLNSGTNASSDLVATADNGNETTNFVDLGINSSTYNTSALTGGINNAYLYSAANDFIIGNSTAGKNLIFFAGGTATSNEGMRINSAGNVGIGNSSPAYKLQVNAAANPLYLAGVQAGSGSDSILTILNGVVRKLLPSSLVVSSSNAWSLVGNAGTNPASNFLGTLDVQPLIIKINSIQTGRFDPNSFALGLGATINNATQSSAIGNNANVGYNHTAAMAIGDNAVSNNDSSFSIGTAAVTNGANSFAIGTGAISNSTSSFALGTGSSSNGTNSFALGRNANAGYSHVATMAIGNGSAVNGDSSFALGPVSVANGANSFAIGDGAASNGASSFALGRYAVTGYSTTDAIAIGDNATANSSNSISIGSNIIAASKTQANAASAIAVGTGAVANSANAIAIGTGATAGYSLTNPVAIGNGAIVNGSNGVALGNGANVSFVANATALGPNASVTGTGVNSTAIGYNAAATLTNELILGDRANSNLSVGIGTESFSTTNREKLLVDLGTTSSVNAIVGRGTNPSYLQLNIQNLSSGTGASSDVVATADNGNETTNFVDLGINSSTNSSGVMGAANDAYLYTAGNNFLIGTGTASKALVFMTGGTTQSVNERMRIDGTGNVGIGTNNPGNKLDINSGTGGVSGLRLKELAAGGVLFVNSTTDVTENNSNLFFDATNYRLSIGAGVTPASTLQVGGSMAAAIVTKTASYSASVNDYTILCNNTSGAITINLPTAAGCAGRVYIIKKTSPAGNTVTVGGFLAETIDGINTYALTTQYSFIMIQSDGINWYIL